MIYRVVLGVCQSRLLWESAGASKPNRRLCATIELTSVCYTLPWFRFPSIQRGSNSLEYAFCVPRLSHGIFIRPSRVRIFPVKQCQLPTAITSLAKKVTVHRCRGISSYADEYSFIQYYGTSVKCFSFNAPSCVHPSTYTHLPLGSSNPWNQQSF